MQQITATDLAQLLLEHPQTLVVDVREAHELVHGMIDGAIHIPMQTIPTSLGLLGDKETQHIVVVCHGGVRSQHVAQYLDEQGYRHVINLIGGMNSWAMNVDDSVSVY